MRCHLKKFSLFSVILAAIIISGARSSSLEECAPEPAAPCYPDDCKRCYCLGPENTAINPAIGPITCNGDIEITVAGFYWTARQDGMEYAVNNEVHGNDLASRNADLNNLIDASYLSPDFSWDLGFKIGANYTSPCDGWDIGVLWTYFHEGAKTHVEAQEDDNHTLQPLWSGYASLNGNAPILFTNDIESFWKFDLNLIDIELGREYWTSKYVTLRPHVGLRLASLDQEFNIDHKGGIWTNTSVSSAPPFHDFVDLDNDFKGIGVRSGLNTVWNLGCGWALFGKAALSIIYGRFSLDHDEYTQDAEAPFSKTKILEAKESLRASRAITDLALGIQWASLVCDCKYGLSVGLAWEHHLFFHQNQMWRVNRLGATSNPNALNPAGENVYEQRRGNLSTQGWTLHAAFAF